MGSHKVLIPTELKALQDMGYETFYPPYLGKERDQSAVYEWSCPPTTLPNDVIKKLSGFNFFWNDISDEIADILNSYFDCVIVTINGDWLLSFLRVFKGKIIYRTFGEPYSLSAHLKSNGAYPLIENHSDFWFMPHCIENAVREEWWLRRREKIVPYCLTDDVLPFAKTWDHNSKNGLIGLTCPNITNPYYNSHFRYLKENFEERLFRYYGVQVECFSDPNVVGTLSREEQLAQFARLSGFLYTYREPNVCYLPPVEMITIGGPVLYFPGSLLDRYLGRNDVGRVGSEDDARRAAKRLVAGDRKFAEEIIESQRSVANRYDALQTLPLLRAAMEEILPLKEADLSEDARSRTDMPIAKNDRPVLLLGHFPGAYSYSSGEYVSVHGIPRVMRRFVQVLTEAGQRVTVTACPEALGETWGFYGSQTTRPDLLDVVDFNRVFHVPDAMSDPADIRSYFSDVRNRKLHWVDGRFPVPVILAGGLVHLLASKPVAQPSAKSHFDPYAYVIVPHYYLFPEAAEPAGANLLLYLPDYMPHFFKGRGWFPDEKSHETVGRKLAQLAKFVMTNSQFTREYLPESVLDVDADKIVAFPMPYLTAESGQLTDPLIGKQLTNVDFIFYPTQAHPNKRLDLLVKSWLLLRASSRTNCKLVLTCGALPPELEKLTRDADVWEDVLFFPGISDATLIWLYTNARCLAFTSEMEGNFPTQIIEALELGCPIVTFDHPTIRGELGTDADLLETAPFADLDAIVNRFQYVRRFRDRVKSKQAKLLKKIARKFSYDEYRTNVLSLNGKMKDEVENHCGIVDYSLMLDQHCHAVLND